MGHIGRACAQVGVRGFAIAAAGLPGEIAAEVLIEVAKKAWDRWYVEHPSPKQRAEDLEAIAQAPYADVRAAAESIARQEAPNASPAEREELAQYLTQIPAQICRALRRPSDPTGKTATVAQAPRSADDLLVVLPPRPPRFKSGDPLPGNADWSLDEPLGMGGFGEVWLARNTVLGDESAIKFCLDQRAAQSLRNEAKLLARIRKEAKHPGIVALQDTQLKIDTPYLRYEYVKGGDLAGLIAQLHADATLTPHARTLKLLAYFRDLVEIVASCHALSPPIVHRDLKPANILVEPDGKSGLNLRITDFGIGAAVSTIALQISSAGQTTRAALLVTLMRGAHTPLYASRQQMKGDDADPRDDVFSLAVILYQMLVGRLDEASPTGAQWKRELMRLGCENDLIDMLEQCFESKREARPPDCNDLLRQFNMLGVGSRLPLRKGEETNDGGRPSEAAIRRVVADWIESVQGKWDEAAFQKFLVERFFRQPGFHHIGDAEVRDFAYKLTADWHDARAKKLEAERIQLEAATKKREEEERARAEADLIRHIQDMERRAEVEYANKNYVSATDLFFELLKTRPNSLSYKSRMAASVELVRKSWESQITPLIQSGKLEMARATCKQFRLTAGSDATRDVLSCIEHSIGGPPEHKCLGDRVINATMYHTFWVLSVLFTGVGIVGSGNIVLAPLIGVFCAVFATPVVALVLTLGYLAFVKIGKLFKK